MEPLQIERDFFDRSLNQWLPLHLGKVALIKGEELIGVFDNELNAVAEGARLFGSEPFLVRRIQPGDQSPSAPAYTLGILGADSKHSITSPGTNS